MIAHLVTSHPQVLGSCSGSPLARQHLPMQWPPCSLSRVILLQGCTCSSYRIVAAVPSWQFLCISLLSSHWGVALNSLQSVLSFFAYTFSLQRDTHPPSSELCSVLSFDRTTQKSPLNVFPRPSIPLLFFFWQPALFCFTKAPIAPFFKGKGHIPAKSAPSF